MPANVIVRAAYGPFDGRPHEILRSPVYPRASQNRESVPCKPDFQGLWFNGTCSAVIIEIEYKLVEPIDTMIRSIEGNPRRTSREDSIIWQ